MSNAKKVLIVQHERVEGPGRVANALELAGVAQQVVRSDLGEAIPKDASAFRGLVVLGGPMGVYEDDVYPYLSDELRLIEDALQRKTPLLGICLGSQLI